MTTELTDAERQRNQDELALLEKFHQKIVALGGEGDYSALEVAVGDLYGAYCAIYEEFVPAFLNAPDRETAADALMDLLLEFNHIVWHVQIAEGALTALMKSLDRHGEVPPKSERRPVAAAVRERRAVYSTRNGKPKRRSPARRTGRRAARKQ